MTGFSGIDVQDMVTQMMRAESFRLNRFTQQRQILSWQQESLRAVGASMMNFRNNFTRIDPLGGGLAGINNPASFRGFSANITNITSSGNNGHTNGITVGTTANTQAGNHTITVNSVAQSHALRGQQHAGTVNSSHIAFGSFIRGDNVVGGDRTFNGNFGISVNGVNRHVNVDLHQLAGGMDPNNPLFNPDAHTALAAINGSQDYIRATQDTIRDLQQSIASERSALQDFGRNLNPRITLSQMQSEDFRNDPDSAWADLSAADQQYILDRLDTIDGIQDQISDLNDDIANQRDIIRSQEAILMNNTAFMNAFVNAVNVELAGFGTVDVGGTSTARATASFANGTFTITAAPNNSIQMQAGQGTHAVGVGAMGFERASSNFNSGQTLGEFMGLQREYVQANDADGNPRYDNNGNPVMEFSHWLNADGSVATAAQTQFSFTISQGGRNVTMYFDVADNPNLTVQQMMTQVNNNPDLNVRMALDTVSNSITLESTVAGEANQITAISDNDGGILARLFNPAGSGVAIGDLIETREATNASVTVNGTTIDRESNNFYVDGMNIAINAGAVGQTFNVNMAGDTATTRQMVMDFVNAYNEIVREIQSLSNVARPRQQGGRGHFMPLTDDQRRGMSESEIALWEQNARTGILHRDQELRNILNDMRNEMSRVVTLEDGTQFSLANMGIRLSTNVADGAILTVNETQLNAALENNMDGVTAIFTGQGATGVSGGNAPTRRDGSPILGLGERLDAALNRHVTEWNTGNLDRRTSERPGDPRAISTRIAEQDRRIENMMRWLERRENQLFAQFSRMEQAMMQANSQMSFLDQFIWGGQ